MAVTFCKIHAFTILVKNIPFHKNFSFVKGDIFILSGYYIESIGVRHLYTARTRPKHVPSNAEKRRESVKAKIKAIYDTSF